MKDAETSLVYQIELDRIDLGLIDQFGEPMTSLFVKSLKKDSNPTPMRPREKIVEQDIFIIMKVISDSTRTNEEKVCYKKARKGFISELAKDNVNVGTAGNRFCRAFKLACENGQLSKVGGNILLPNVKQDPSPQLNLPF